MDILEYLFGSRKVVKISYHEIIISDVFGIFNFIPAGLQIEYGKPVERKFVYSDGWFEVLPNRVRVLNAEESCNLWDIHNADRDRQTAERLQIQYHGK